jgi:repressor LexA
MNAMKPNLKKSSTKNSAKEKTSLKRATNKAAVHSPADETGSGSGSGDDISNDNVVELSEAGQPRPLSPKEKNVLEFLELYIREHGLSPTYQEICQHFGFASFNSVQRYLKQLEAKGYIQLPWANQKRAITLLKPSSAVRTALDELQDFASLSFPKSPAGKIPSMGVPNTTPAILSAENFSLPLLGRVAAGAPIEAIEHDEYIDVPASLVRQPDRTYALRVQGQSMIEDGILDGDVILVQRQTTASNGEIVVAMVGEEATVKRFYMYRGPNIPTAARQAAEDNDLNPERIIELRPANSSMSPMWFDPSQIQIRGVVVGLIRRFF